MGRSVVPECRLGRMASFRASHVAACSAGVGGCCAVEYETGSTFEQLLKWFVGRAAGHGFEDGLDEDVVDDVGDLVGVDLRGDVSGSLGGVEESAEEGVTTRVGGAPTGDGEVGFGCPAEDELLDSARRGSGWHCGHAANQSDHSDFYRPIEISVEAVFVLGFGSHSVDGGPAQVDQEVLFAAEVVIEGAFGHSGGFDNGVDGDVFEVLGLPETDGCVDQLVPGLT